MSQPKQDHKRWYALTVELETQAREAVEYALMEAGALGTETHETDEELVNVTAYFDLVPPVAPVRQPAASTSIPSAPTPVSASGPTLRRSR